MPPSVCGMLQREHCSKPSSAGWVLSLALRSAQMARRSPVGLGKKSVCGMLQREHCNIPSPNTRTGSRALRSAQMEKSSPVGVGMKPSVCGMLQREHCNKPSPATGAMSLALRSARMARRSLVGAPMGVPMARCSSGTSHPPHRKPFAKTSTAMGWSTFRISRSLPRSLDRQEKTFLLMSTHQALLLYRRARACPSLCIGRDSKRPWSEIAGDRPPRYGRKMICLAKRFLIL